ncbi:unnamed protein product [Allacma fusca]|uniref:Uncharacterized protein n=1 Tax=Allacma fusca TaxID=39272 RepID=A0A8J2JG55_9HEXA|nr:unnamed protein product [Allacma fusca]
MQVFLKKLRFSVWSAQKMRSGIRTEEYG